MIKYTSWGCHSKVLKSRWFKEIEILFHNSISQKSSIRVQMGMPSLEVPSCLFHTSDPGFLVLWLYHTNPNLHLISLNTSVDGFCSVCLKNAYNRIKGIPYEVPFPGFFFFLHFKVIFSRPRYCSVNILLGEPHCRSELFPVRL